MPIRITGIDKVLKANGAATGKLGKSLAEGLAQCAQILLNKSQKLVPVDTSALKDSAVIMNVGGGMEAVSTVSYGGSEAPYAFVVHARLDVYHAPPTQARYLSDAVNAVRGTMTAVLKRQLRIT